MGMGQDETTRRTQVLGVGPCFHCPGFHFIKKMDPGDFGEIDFHRGMEAIDLTIRTCMLIYIFFVFLGGGVPYIHI